MTDVLSVDMRANGCVIEYTERLGLGLKQLRENVEVPGIAWNPEVAGWEPKGAKGMLVGGTGASLVRLAAAIVEAALVGEPPKWPGSQDLVRKNLFLLSIIFTGFAGEKSGMPREEIVDALKSFVAGPQREKKD